MRARRCWVDLPPQASISAALILGLLEDCGLKLHAFGLKKTGLELALGRVTSADSRAWSYHARKEHADKQKWLPHEQRTKTGHQNCLEFALAWFRDTISACCASTSAGPTQHACTRCC